MYPKCSLNSYSSYLQIFGLLVLVIILIIAGIYYMRIYHKNILEKYDNSLNLNSKETKESQSGDRSTYPKNKYPGAEGSTGTTGTTEDKYTFRECKVYFTENIAACDSKTDDGTIPKTCSYTFDGWQEFDTYTDSNGRNIIYPKKIFNKDMSNTNEIINAAYTNKCFKEFNNLGNGKVSAKPFEYSENKLVRHDSKGTQDDIDKDTNKFGGKKYTSIQFLSSESPLDNFNDVISSICSLKYTDIHRELENKIFYQFILNANNTINSIKKVKLNDDQTNFTEIQNIDPVKDFAVEGKSGIRINNNKLEIFIKSSDITKRVNIYKFIYTTNLCNASKIKTFNIKNKDINLSKFINFFGCTPERRGIAKTSPIVTNIDISVLIDLLTDQEKQKFIVQNVDYREDILRLIREKRQAKEREIRLLLKQERDIKEAEIEVYKRQKTQAIAQINNYVPADKTFLGVVNLKKEGSSERIFDYKQGYINTNFETYNIQDGTIYLGKSTFIFTHSGITPQKEHTFIVPEGTTYYCDILLVGGGGAGGNKGGAGGGGDVLEFKNIEFKTGNYKIRVGDGGNGKKYPTTCSCGYPGRPGNNTSITIGSNTITAAGGGGGGSHCYEHPNDGLGRGWVPSACIPTKTPTAEFLSPYTYTHKHKKGEPTHTHRIKMKSSGGGGGAGNQSQNNNIKGGSGNTVSGNGGRCDDNNQQSGGAGGGAAPPSKGGNGGNSSIKKGKSYNGDGGRGIISTITGKEIEYGGGGAAGRWNTGVNKRGISSGGGGYQKWPDYYEAIPHTGGGGTQSMRGASGVVIIKINSSTSFKAKQTRITLDDLYTIEPPENKENQKISIPANNLESNCITAFVYLQKGYYRFRADIGNKYSAEKFGNPNIRSAWLGIYDERTKIKGTEKYRFLKVFKYKDEKNDKNEDEKKPSYLKPYLNIDSNKFYKLIYFYTADNIENLEFNLWYKYLDSEPSLEPKYLRTNAITNARSIVGYSDSGDILTNPSVNSSTIIGVTDKYLMFTYSGLASQTEYTFTIKEELNCDILIVAGGGAGGRNRFQTGRAGGGGGAGGLIFLEKQNLSPGTYNIIVGAGGNIDEGGNNKGEGFDGNNSSITGMINYTAKGGGGGGTTFQDDHYTKGRNGGSGGGAGAGAAEHWNIIPPGNSEAGQGFNGGGNMARSWAGGAGAGGGGAGGYGWSWQQVGNIGGAGGNGKSINITGTSVTYAKGGDGGNWNNNNTPKNGESNTGNGGDGAAFKPAGKGGSGIVIIRYRDNTLEKLSKLSVISKKSSNTVPNSIPNIVTINDSEKINNDDEMYESENITDISDDMNSYLFSGKKNNNKNDNDIKKNSVYQHYYSKTMREIFSKITYNNENYIQGKNFEKLVKDYLKLESLNFFNFTEYDSNIKTRQDELKEMIKEEEINIQNNTIINDLNTLTTNINGLYKNKRDMNYIELIGAADACLKPNTNISDIILDESDKTYNKIPIENLRNIQNLLEPNLVSSIYIEAIS
jgi:hypothetical protein